MRKENRIGGIECTRKYHNKSKKYSVSIIVLGTSVEKFFHVWFEFFPIYRGRKKGTEKKFFEAEAEGRGWEMFSRFPFFYRGILEKTQIRREKIFSSDVPRTIIETECFFNLLWYFRAHSIPPILFSFPIFLQRY